MKLAKESVVVVGLLLTSFTGCVTTTTKNGQTIATEPFSLSKPIETLTGSMKRAVSAVTPKQRVEPLVWRWSAGIPQSVDKAEFAAASVPQEAVAAFVPQFQLDSVQLVSTHSSQPLSIDVVNSTRIKSIADLNLAIAESDTNEPTNKEIIEIASASGTSVPAKITTQQLQAVGLASLPNRTPIRVVESGNPWVLLRDDSVRYKLMLRKEQRTGLVHLALSVKVCWGPEVVLPIDVTLHSDGKTLPCLDVQQTLNRLYGPELKRPAESVSSTFARIATQDEYLVPANYRDLETRHAEKYRLANVRTNPAFATVGGIAYPGPPVLGDARALASFLFQPKRFGEDDQEYTGWVVFDGADLNSNEIDVTLTLSSGSSTVRFRIPDVIAGS